MLTIKFFLIVKSPNYNTFAVVSLYINNRFLEKC